METTNRTDTSTILITLLDGSVLTKVSAEYWWDAEEGSLTTEDMAGEKEVFRGVLSVLVIA